jgi:Ca2+-binding EF-hand superfamily protein
LKGFKKNESTVFFIEKLIEELKIMDPLPELKTDAYLGVIAQKILLVADKKKVQPDTLSDEELEEILKPLIKNYENFNVIFETHSTGSKLLTKLLVKEGSSLESDHIIKLFDESSNYIGISGKMVGRTGYYVIVTVDKYEKIENRNDMSEEEFNEYKRLFRLFDTNLDGLIYLDEFNEVVTHPGVKALWPMISILGNFFFPKDRKSINLNEFIDSILLFTCLDNDDAIRRIWNLYCDDIDNDTLSLVGLKKLANDLEVEPHRNNINMIYKFAVDKNSMVTYKEFRDFIKSEVKKNNIKLPSIKK